MSEYQASREAAKAHSFRKHRTDEIEEGKHERYNFYDSWNVGWRLVLG